MLDAYSVRKAVPRIVLAVIGINLSIYLCVAAVEVTNIVGSGIGDLITAPFLEADTFGALGLENNAANSIAFGGLLISGIIGGAAIWAIGGLALIGMLIPIVITVVLITFAIIFTLVIRQGLIIFLTIVSPVAIALFVLPGTEKYFKKWLDLFIKTLLVYPIVAIIFAMSTVLASILIGTAGDSPDAIGLAKLLATIIVVFAPLVMIPFAFKLAGGSMAAIMNAANGRTANLSGRAGQGFKKWRDDSNSWAGKRLQTRKDERIEKGRTAGQVAAGLAGGFRNKRSGGTFKSGYSAASGAITTEDSLHRSQEIGKHQAVQAIAGNDDFLEAIMSGPTAADTRRYLESRVDGNGNRIYQGQNLEKAIASVERARAVGSHEEVSRWAAVQNVTTGTGYGGGAGEMLERINEVAGDDRVLAANMLAQARSAAGQARRPDLVGGGFGDQLGQLEQMHAGTLNSGQATQHLDRQALDTQSGGAILSARRSVIERLAPTMVGDLQSRADNMNAADQAVRSATTPQEKQKAQQTKDQASRAFKQELAALAGRYEVAGQVSPENARALADNVLNQTIHDPSTGQDVNILQAMEAWRGDAEFMQMKRDYGQNALAAHTAHQAAQAAAAAQQGAGQQPPGGIPPVPGAVSDARLKEAIKYLGLHNELKLYRFKYLWSDIEYVGVMAQDILGTHPQAISYDEFGFMRVNYELLGLEMTTYEEWSNNKNHIYSN